MACLCAPTTHAGSFRCRLHRSQQSWGGRPMPSKTSGDEDLEVSTASLIESSLQRDQNLKTVASLPSPPRAPSTAARTTPKGSSRLRNVVSSSDEEDEVQNPAASSSNGEPRMRSVKMATGTGGSYSSAPGGRAAMFRMLKTGNSTSKIFS